MMSDRPVIIIRPNTAVVRVEETPTRVIELGIPGPPSDVANSICQELLTIDVTAQTLFTLMAIAVRPETSTLFLNGVKATYGRDYLLDGVLLTWLMPLQLQPEDKLEIYYQLAL
jgi:hypothetical protein